FGRRSAAAFAGLAYGLSGFFAGHSSHTPMFQAAAWLPWLLLLFTRAIDHRIVQNAAAGVLVAGAIILAGHFQTALYCFAALALFGLSRIVTKPDEWRRIVFLGILMP